MMIFDGMESCQRGMILSTVSHGHRMVGIGGRGILPAKHDTIDGRMVIVRSVSMVSHLDSDTIDVTMAGYKYYRYSPARYLMASIVSLSYRDGIDGGPIDYQWYWYLPVVASIVFAPCHNGSDGIDSQACLVDGIDCPACSKRQYRR